MKPVDRHPAAADPAASRGRRHLEPGGETRGPRTVFQRDRDRIIHSVAFRRLRHKTQVFIAPAGDHVRVRLTHSLEVAQIGRTIARALGLDEDLVEALCLAHDIGHPPFGHAGEQALDLAMARVGGFDHNAQTVRTLTRLEMAYPAWPGLNLSWEMLEGLAKHNGPVPHPNWAMQHENDDFPLDLGRWPSLEAQVAAIADDIAYDNHDIDDGLRSGLLCADDILAVPLVARHWHRVRRRFPDHPPQRLYGELIREQIGTMVNDVIAETRHRLMDAGIRSLDAVRAAGRPLVGFSQELAGEEADLKARLYALLYHHPSQKAAGAHAGVVIQALYSRLVNEPALLPTTWHGPQGVGPEPLSIDGQRQIGDFIAGMTDRFAIACYERWCAATAD